MAALPSARSNIVGVTVGDVFYVTGGIISGNEDTFPRIRNTIVSYDPESDSWQEAGITPTSWHSHAGTAVPLDAMKIFCPEL